MSAHAGSVGTLVLDILEAEACWVPVGRLYGRVEEIRGCRSDSVKRAVDRLISEGRVVAAYSLWHETRYRLKGTP